MSRCSMTHVMGQSYTYRLRATNSKLNKACVKGTRQYILPKYLNTYTENIRKLSSQ